MNTRLLLVSLLIGVLLSACGPSQAQLDASATQVAAVIFATQTAQAPTITPTFTPSPTPTETPTSTLTPLPTNTPTLVPTPSRTPTRARTPTLRSTPAPRLMPLALTADDLPSGFVAMPPQLLRDVQQSWPDGTCAFALTDEKRSQVVLGVLMPYAKRAEQLAFDASLPQFVEYMAASVGATDHKKLDGLDDIGEARAAVTSVSRPSSITYRWDIVAFRRGEVAALLIVVYPDGDKPAGPAGDLARLLEARVNQFGGLQAASLGRK